jgi:hypothetical protein
MLEMLAKFECTKIGGLVSISIRWVANELDLRVPTTCRVGSCVVLQKREKKEEVGELVAKIKKEIASN